MHMPSSSWETELLIHFSPPFFWWLKDRLRTNLSISLSTYLHCSCVVCSSAAKTRDSASASSARRTAACSWAAMASTAWADASAE